MWTVMATKRTQSILSSETEVNMTVLMFLTSPSFLKIAWIIWCFLVFGNSPKLHNLFKVIVTLQ